MIWNRKRCQTGGINNSGVSPLSRDFTLEKYQELCRVLLEKSAIYTVFDYLSKKPDGNVIILRHDVDRKIKNSLRMAQLEHQMGIRSSYYFRYPFTFNPDVIRKIHDLGHEIGYHYEVFAKAKGDPKRAIALFEQELGSMRNICEIRTICMHGSPLSPYDNRDLWKYYRFGDFGISGEAFLSLQKILYFSDTGRNWSFRNSLRDRMNSGLHPVPAETTNDLIQIVRSKKESGLYLTIHPERWTDSMLEYNQIRIQDFIFNQGKRVLSWVRA